MAWTEDQLKAAARKALAAGDTAAAQRLIAEARKVGASQPVPAGMTPEQFAYQKARKAGQMPTPLEGPAPVDPARGEIEDSIMRMGLLTPEQQFKLSQMPEDQFVNAIDPGGVEAGMRGMGQGLSFGLMDEASAGLRGLFTGDYGKALGEQRLMDEVSRYARPKTALAGEIAGAVMLPGAGGAKVASQGASLAAKAGRGAAAGAASGAAYGFGTGEGGFDERLAGARDSGAVGGLVGMAIPGAGAIAKALAQKVANSAAGKAAVKLAPSGDELRAMAGKIFDRADQTGMPRAELTGAFPGMQAGAVRAGMDDILTPQSARAVSRIEDAATTPNPTIGFRELDILRRQAQIPAGNNSMPVEAAIGSKLVSGLDDVLEKASPGTAKEVAEARAMWGQLRRSEKIEEAIRRAGDHPSGFAQGIMTEFRSILRDPKKLRGFSQQEQDAMRKLTSRITPQSMLSVIGKFGPRMSGNGNVVGSTAGATTGGILGSFFGPAGAAIGAVAAPALGAAAHTVSNRSAAKQADVVRALVAMGAQAPQASTKAPEAIRKLLEQSLFGAALPVTERMPAQTMPR